MDSIGSTEMPRRAFMALIAGGLLTAPISAEAQPTVPRIGYLSLAPGPSPRSEALRQGFRDLVASLARPGGNITGLSGVNPELTGKRLDLLKQAVPRLSRVAIVWNPAEPNAAFLRETQAAGRGLGLQLRVLEIRAAADLEPALHAAKTWRADGLIVLTDPVTLHHRKRLADLADRYRLPAIYSERLFVESGGLMSYGANDREMRRRAAVFVDRILKGAKPADLPVEQPTNYELVINLKTVKALGLTIPQSLLARADEAIQ